jgi:hypothetical protein
VISSWSTEAARDLNFILSTQAADGAFRLGNICGESNNFMAGILGSVLILYYENIARDPRILSTIRSNMRFMRTTQWRPTDQVFNYFSGPCDVGGPTPAWDLNGLFLESFGWLAREDSDRSLLTFADSVMAGLTARTWMNGSKQFSQAYAMSWRYLWYRENF